jgi:PKHD-type hydroxylase
MRFGPQQTPPLTDQKTHIFLEGALATAECAKLVADAARIPPETGQLIGGEESSGVRRCAVRWLPEGDDFGWVNDRLIDLVAAANRDHFTFDLWGIDERLQLLDYQGGEQGFFDWHCDRGRTGFAKARKLSISVQLSDEGDYAGGALELNPDGTVVEAPRAIGTATIFAANVLHRVAPVTAGRRHALTAWFHGPHFR